MATVFTETFETDGNGTRYTTSIPEFSDGSGDFFTRTDGSNITSSYSVLNPEGSFYFAAQDLDGEGDASQQTLTFSGIDIAGFTNLNFSTLLAEDDDGTNQDWDLSDFVLFEYQIDGGEFTDLLAIESIPDGDNFNAVPAQDTDFDGNGDGTEVTDTFASFSSAIAGTGSTLNLRITFDFNAGDEDIALDNIEITGDSGGGGTTFAIAPTDAVKAEGNSGNTPFTFTVTRSGDTTGATSVDFAVTSSEADAADFGGVLPSGTVNFADGETSQEIEVNVSGDTDPELDESFTVTLSNPNGGETITTAIANGTIQNDDGVALTPISTVQGSGASSPIEGQTVTIEAVVVGDFQDGASGTNGDLNGFFVQEEDADADADPLTSEGLFIFDGSNPAVDVNIGDVVQVTGTVGEAFGQTQLSNVTVSIQGTDTLPTPATVNFPVTAVDDLESFEGMGVTIPDTLFVTEYFNLDRFGEVVLSSDGASNEPGTDGRLDQYTDFNTPDVAGFGAYQEAIATRRIVLDDGQTVQNPDPIILGRGGNPLSATNTLRGGDTVDNLSGVLSFGFGEYRVQPVAPVDFQATNPRPATPEDVGGDLKVVSLNVLNYFTTLDDETPRNGTPLTAIGQEPRGANDLTADGITPATAEFDRQTEKLVTTILEIDADVLGLVELENDFQAGSSGNAIEFLVNQLNADPRATGTYAWVDPGQQFVDTSDAISVGAIYKTDTVQIAPGTTVEILTDSDLPALGLGGTVFDGVNTNRAPIAVSFEEISTGEVLTVSVNHFKSKGGNGSGDNADIGDGQGNFNGTRLRGSEALEAWLETDPTGSGDEDFLIIGDLNAYAEEDPITFLEDQGYTDLIEQFVGNDAYSFVFDGQFGYLDYGLANESLLSQVTGTTEWHVNADEPDAFDYNLDFGRDPSLFDGQDPFRNSDHDPVIIGLDLVSIQNTAPDAVDDAATTNLETVISVDVLGNDTDADGDTLSIDSFDTTGTIGTVTDNGDGTFSYDPNGQFGPLNPGETLTDSFTYTVSDGTDTDTATVNITLFDGIIIEGDNEPALEIGGRTDESLLVLGDGNEADLGNGDDTTAVNGDGNVIDAGLGDDETTVTGDANTIETGIGSDIVEVEGESNTIETGSGTDDIDITGDNNTVEAGSGNDEIDIVGDGTVLDAGNGNDDITVTGDASTIDAGSGNDVIVVVGDDNEIDGGRGDDDITGTGQNLIVDGGDGNDVIIINTDNGTLGAQVSGGNGNDTIAGSLADDILLGNQDDDVIDGRDGDDIIEGNKGTDNLTGGAGADIFRFGNDAADGLTNLIVDFQQGVDVLAIEDLNLNEFITNDGGQTYDFSIGNKTLTVGFTNPVTLTGADFTNYEDTFV